MEQLLTEEPVPKLILGTVQLGMAYGIANTSGQPDRDAARQIVKTALDHNIRHFDTAQAYGQSESVLGGVLEELGVNTRVHVGSKLSATLDPLDAARVEVSVKESLSRLRVDRLWCMLLHQPAWLTSWDHGLGNALHRYQAEGRIGRLGVSLNTVNDAAAALAQPDMAILQAPCNAWDRRMEELGFLEQARTAGRLCCIRSVYLQGLLTMAAEAVAERLPPAREASVRWWKLAGEFGVSPKELALRYALTLQAPLVIGAESPDQVADTARLADLAPLSPADVQSIALIMDPVLDEHVIEPWRW